MTGRAGSFRVPSISVSFMSCPVFDRTLYEGPGPFIEGVARLGFYSCFLIDQIGPCASNDLACASGPGRQESTGRGPGVSWMWIGPAKREMGKRRQGLRKRKVRWGEGRKRRHREVRNASTCVGLVALWAPLCHPVMLQKASGQRYSHEVWRQTRLFRLYWAIRTA